MLAALTTRSQLKWTNVERVYANLVNAVGDGSKIAPPIELSKSESRVAYYSPSKQTIYVEQRFLQICSSFGSDSLNALAFILGHELAHFYRNHGWVHSSGMGYVDAELKANWKELSRDADNHAKDEAEADIFSGFYALVAGYNAMGVAANTLKTVYRAYGIQDTVPGYPSLGQRMEIANNAMQKSEELFMLFKVGVYCLSTEKYEVASRLFTNIYNQDYAGTEILNNLAISEILWGYRLYGEQPSYYYPVFITTETALDPDSRAGGEGEEHIRKGLTYLKTALGKEPKNASLLINTASAHAMLNEFTDAEYYLAKALESGCDELAASNLKGIIAAKKGDEKLAKGFWKSERKNDPLIALNYAIAFDDMVFGSAANQAERSIQLQPIDEVNLEDPQLKSKFRFKSIKMPGLKISYAELPNSMLIEVYGGSGINYLFQSFSSNKYEAQDLVWQTTLTSATSVVYSSKNYNVLKIKTSGTQIPEYIKYAWNN